MPIQKHKIINNMKTKNTFTSTVKEIILPLFSKQNYSLKYVTTLAIGIIISFNSCIRESAITNEQVNCNGKKMLAFQNLQELQDKYNVLKGAYDAIDDDAVQALIDFENSRNFYSLRKKQAEMDEGVIPDIPSFDADQYSIDDIFQTFLNEEGMIIIDNTIYLWDDGCVLFYLPFSCSNQFKLQILQATIKQNEMNTAASLIQNYNIKTLNSCSDARFDFESVAEELGGRTPKPPGDNVAKSGAGCGNIVKINTNLLSCANGFYMLEVKMDQISPPNYSSLTLWSISSTDQNLYDQIKVLYPITGTLESPLLPYGLIPINPLSPNGVFILKIPLGSPYFEINLENNSSPLNGNSCQAFDKLGFNSSCPLSISSTFLSQTSAGTTYSFSINNNSTCPNPMGKIDWDFGDGSSIVNGGFTITHTFTTPCGFLNRTVKAAFMNSNGTPCTFLSTIIELGDYCKRDKYKFLPKIKGSADGKKYKLTSKIRKRSSPFNGSKIIHKFKWRTDGTKTISNYGPIFKENATSSNCTQVDISSLISPESLNKKKRLKVKYNSPEVLYIDASQPYSVKYSHSKSSFQPVTYFPGSDLKCSE